MGAAQVTADPPLPSESETPWPPCLAECGHSFAELAEAAAVVAALQPAVDQPAASFAMLDLYHKVIHDPDRYRRLAGVGPSDEADLAEAGRSLAATAAKDTSGIMFRHPALLAATTLAMTLGEEALTDPDFDAAASAAMVLHAAVLASSGIPQRLFAEAIASQITARRADGR